MAALRMQTGKDRHPRFSVNPQRELTVGSFSVNGR